MSQSPPDSSPSGASASAAAPEEGGEKAPNKFGTFGGVFTPSILTILGVVMYLRLGWVVGNVGLAGALIIVAVAHLITLATGMSVASIATNRTVGAGGAYYIISRSLGAPAGAAIGIPLFFGQALSVTFYIVGFTESLTLLFPNLPVKIVGTATLVALTLITLKSSDLAIKTQYVVMAMIALSLVSFFAGTSDTPPAKIEYFNDEGAGFGAVFAVFFPAVTGIMAGVGMSGDLKDSRKSLPRGTLLAIFVGFCVYMTFPVWLSLNATNQQLIDDPNIVFKIAFVPMLISIGVWGATISSAIGSILTAPRTLQALAIDGLMPKFLGDMKGGEPRNGIFVTFALAEVGILLGDLDAIAGVLTMFFLATYGFTNLASGLERWAASPSYRPEFNTPAWISLAGAAGCFYVMSVIDLRAMIVALLLCGGIYLWVQRRALDTTYGDARHGLWAALVLTALQRLRRTEFHPQNWRPNLIILGGEIDARPHLLELGSTIVQERGIVTYFQLLAGRVRDYAGRRKELQQTLEERVAESYPNVFSRVDIVDDLFRGAVQVAQSYGVGNLDANTVMVGWPRNDKNMAAYLTMLRDLVRLERSLLVVTKRPERGFGRRENIHIWWSGQPGTGGLMILLAFLITADHRWRKAKVTLLRAIDGPEQLDRAHSEINTVLSQSRLSAETRVIDRNGRPLADVMGEHSGNADLAILGLPSVETSPAHFYGPMEKLVEALPTAILVRGAAGFASDAVLHDEVVDSAGHTPAPGPDGTEQALPGGDAEAADVTPAKPTERKSLGRRKKTKPDQIAAVVSVRNSGEVPIAPGTEEESGADENEAAVESDAEAPPKGDR